jgi:hypothetical protein
MLQMLYSKFWRKNKETCHQKPQKMTALEKHWLNSLTGKCKQFLPLPLEAALEIATVGEERQQKVLDGIHKRLSTLEEKILGKSYPSGNELHQPMRTPN